MTQAADVIRVLGELAEAIQRAVDRAVPAAARIAGVIRVGGVLGLIGGVLGAAGLALPGVGLARSWGFFALLMLIAVTCAGVVWRWGMVLREWSGDVGSAVARIRALPTPQEAVDRLRDTVEDLRRAENLGAHRKDLGRVLDVVRSGRSLRQVLKRVPGGTGVAANLVREVTGPFRPPLVLIRLALLAGGLAMVVVGPLLFALALVI